MRPDLRWVTVELREDEVRALLRATRLFGFAYTALGIARSKLKQALR